MKGHKRRNSELTLIIRDSLSGQKMFGNKVQPEEHEVQGELTQKINEWNLGNEHCHYFEFN